MNCQEIQILVPDLLMGDLEPSLFLEVQEHLAQCPACSGEIDELSALWAELGVLPEEQPSPALRTGFYAMLARESRKQTASQKKLPQWLKSIPRHPYWMAAALLMAVGGFGLGRWVQGGLNNNPTGIGQDGSSLAVSADLSMLRSPASGQRLMGVVLITQKGSHDPSLAGPLLNLLDNDASVQVRLAAVEALYLFAGSPDVRSRIIASLDRQTSPLVQMALADLLVGLREKRANEALQRLVRDQRIQPEVRERAQSNLTSLHARL